MYRLLLGVTLSGGFPMAPAIVNRLALNEPCGSRNAVPRAAPWKPARLIYPTLWFPLQIMSMYQKLQPTSGSCLVNFPMENWRFMQFQHMIGYKVWVNELASWTLLHGLGLVDILEC